MRTGAGDVADNVHDAFFPGESLPDRPPTGDFKSLLPIDRWLPATRLPETPGDVLLSQL
jgi:hypothetical protein